MAAALSYGKRCLKAVLDKDVKKKKRNVSTPEDDCIFWVEAGLDKEGFTVKYISDYKGFGVFSTTKHKKGDFLLQYVGEQISADEAKERDKKHTDNMLFYFVYKGKQLCIDATSTEGQVCQFVNDGKKNEINCKMKLKVIRNMPRLCLFALKDIHPGEELLYDYGDLTKNLWWRKKEVNKFGCDNNADDDDFDDDPFDIRKVSDISSEDFVTDSCSDSLRSEIIQHLSYETRKGSEIDRELIPMLYAHVEPEEVHSTQRYHQQISLDRDDEPRHVEEDTEIRDVKFLLHVDAYLESVNVDVVEEVNCLLNTSTDADVKPAEIYLETDEHFNNDTALNTEDESSDKPLKSTEVKPRKERPGRMCIFCDKIIEGGKLKRHIKSHQKTHAEVAAILKKPTEEQNKWFEEKRHEGIYKYNMLHLHQHEDQLMRERKPKTPDELRMCLECRKFFSNRTFYKHKEACSSQAQPVKTQTLRPLDLHHDDEFVLNILNKFRDGPVGSYIRENKILQTIGYKHYLARKVESSKSTEVRREVMMEMRELGRLFLCFKSLAEDAVTFEDLYERSHLQTLKEAFNNLCTGEEGEKYGLKVNLNSIFQRSMKILAGYYSEAKLDSKVKELERFKKAYNFNLPDIIGKARYHTEKNSLKKARLPKNLPVEDDMRKLKHFLVQEITDTMENFSLCRYTWLRSLVVARLTLYNARRGEEGSRLLLEEFRDAMSSTWIPLDTIEYIKDDAEKYLLGKFKLAYMAGKGRKCVPILIPNDLVGPIEVLISNRQSFGIAENNEFLFATKSSNSHCSGFHAVSCVCEAAGVSSVSATKNRHRASTIYASLDMSDNDRRIFYDHLGHDESINKDNYQCPAGINEVRVMGKFLSSLEDGVEERVKEKKLLTKDACTEELSCKEKEYETSNDPGLSSRKIKLGNKSQRGSFRWTEVNTQQILQDFGEWINVKTGNSLPSKNCLEKYLAESTSLSCTLVQLRTKIMNEQNKRKKIHSNKIQKLSG